MKKRRPFSPRFIPTTTILTLRRQLLRSSIRELSSKLQLTLTSVRRLMHRHPELMYRERKTGEIVRRILRDMGVADVSAGKAKNIHSQHYHKSSKHNNHRNTTIIETQQRQGQQFDSGVQRRRIRSGRRHRQRRRTLRLAPSRYGRLAPRGDVRLDLNCVHISVRSVDCADRNRHMVWVIITIRIR